MTDTVKEYAQALFSLAKETQAEESILSELDFVREVFDKTEGYLEFLASPAVDLGDRLKSVEDAFGDSICEYAVSFLCIVVKNGHISDLYELIDAYRQMYNESIRVSVAKVRSFVPLSEDEKATLRKKLEAKYGVTVELDCETDETLIGGIVVDIDGVCLDASVKSRLLKLKDVMNR